MKVPEFQASRNNIKEKFPVARKGGTMKKFKLDKEDIADKKKGKFSAKEEKAEKAKSKRKGAK